MAINLDLLFDAESHLRDDNDFRRILQDQEAARKRTTWTIAVDLATFVKAQGYTQNQTRNALEALFSTFASEWLLYVFIGSSALADAITADATLAWLDLDASGQTIRARIINRLA